MSRGFDELELVEAGFAKRWCDDSEEDYYYVRTNGILELITDCFSEKEDGFSVFIFDLEHNPIRKASDLAHIVRILS